MSRFRRFLLPSFLFIATLAGCAYQGGRIFSAGVLHPQIASAAPILPDSLPVEVRIPGPLRVSSLTITKEQDEWLFSGRICSGGRSHIFHSNLALELTPVARSGGNLQPRHTHARLQPNTRRHHGKRCAPFSFPIPAPQTLERLVLSQDSP